MPATPASSAIASIACVATGSVDRPLEPVTRLIRAGEDAFEDLTPEERAKLLELFGVLRATRARMDGTIGIEQVGGTRNPEPTFTPPALTPLPSVRALHGRTSTG